MNCKQVQELLPLYVGRDLEAKRESLVTAHVQSCAECACAADQYRETRQLLQDFAPPVFSEDVYAGIRGRVLREIQESTGPSLPEFVAAWFRPRLTWAVASAVLIASVLFAIYFITNRGNDGHDAAEKRPATVQPSVNHQPEPRSQGDTQAALPSPSNERIKDERLVRQPRKKSRDALTARANSATVIVPDAKSAVANVSPQPNNSAEPGLFPAPDSAASEKILRVEIQTKDPNIRIIWFTSPETKPAVPNSKGI
jgi:hypothetical protein